MGHSYRHFFKCTVNMTESLVIGMEDRGWPHAEFMKHIMKKAGAEHYTSLKKLNCDKEIVIDCYLRIEVEGEREREERDKKGRERGQMGDILTLNVLLQINIIL